MSEDTSNTGAQGSMTQEQFREIKSEFYELGTLLGITLDKSVVNSSAVYPESIINEVRMKFEERLAETTSPQGKNKEYFLAKDLATSANGGHPDGADIAKAFKIFKDSTGNMNVLSSVADNALKAAAPQSSANVKQQQSDSTASTTTTEMRYDNAPNANVMALETALIKIIPVLNALDKGPLNIDISPLSKISEIGVADGYVDSDLQSSYSGVMKHLNYLSYATNNSASASAASLKDMASFIGGGGNADALKEQQSNKFDPSNASTIQAFLQKEISNKISANTTKIINDYNGDIKNPEVKKLIEENRDLKELRDDEIPAVMKAIATLHNNKTLETLDVKKEVIIEQETAPIVAAPTETAPTETAPTETAPIVAAPIVAAPTETKNNDDALKAEIEEMKAEAHQNKINNSVESIEQILLRISGKVKDIDTMGLSDSIVTPITQADLDDGKGVFGEKSQEFLAKAIVLFKTMANEGKPADKQDNNPNGLYTKEFGEQFKLEVLTNPAMDQLREAFSIEPMTKEDRAIYFKTLPSTAEDTDKTALAEAKAKIEEKLGLGTVKEGGSVDDADRYTLNGFIASLNIISDAGNILDEEKARSNTKMNIMLDGIHTAMDKWMPGFSSMLKDFFTGSDFGKMVGGILSMFGINVNRLWGDKNDLGVDAAKPVIDKQFDKFVNAAKNELGTDDFGQVMAQAKLDMLDKFENPDGLKEIAQKFAFDKTMSQLFEGKDDTYIKGVIMNAMDAATATGNYDNAKTAFFDNLKEAGAEYQSNMSPTNLDKVITSTEKMLQQPDVQNTVQSYTETYGSNKITPAAVVAGTEPKIVPETPVEQTVNMNVIEAGDNLRVGITFNRNNMPYDPRPLRFSRGRVDDIVKGLAELESEVITSDMVKKDGKFLDMATPNVSGMIEDALVQAQIHALKEKYDATPDEKDGISRDDLNNITHKLTSDNIGEILPVLLAYMEHNGASEEAVTAVSQNLTALAEDHYSTKLDGNPKQDISVLDQSFLWNQISLDMMKTVAPVVAVIPEPIIVTNTDTKEIETEVISVNEVPRTIIDNGPNPLYDKYWAANEGKIPCDIPLFTKMDNGDVVALIREKNDGIDDFDPSDDKYTEMTLKGYVESRNIDDKNILKALQDNYRWNVGDEDDIEAYINKILCLEEIEVKPTPPIKEEVSVSSAFDQAAMCNSGTPATFKDLCRLTADQALTLKKDGLDVEAIFKEVDPLHGTNGTSRFMILELGKFNKDGAGRPDAIIALHDGANIDYRTVTYGNNGDYIKSLSDQRSEGLAGLRQHVNSPDGPRSLDTFLTNIEAGRQAPNSLNGYLSIDAIIPTDNKGGVGTQSALRYIYGDNAVNTVEYHRGYLQRTNAMGAYNETQRYLKLTGNAAPFNNYIKTGGDIANTGKQEENNQPTVVRKCFLSAVGSDCGHGPKDILNGFFNLFKENSDDTGTSSDTPSIDPLADLRAENLPSASQSMAAS